MKLNITGFCAGVLLMAFSTALLVGCSRANGNQADSSRIMHPANAAEFQQQTSKGVVLVDFYADWCGPCRRLGPTLTAVADQATDATVVKVNVDTNQDLARQFNVRSIPFLVLMKDGKIQGTKLGLQTKDDLLAWLTEAK